MSSVRALVLYKDLLREASKFPSYIYRSYALRRIRDAFRENRNVTDPEKLKELYRYAQENLDIIKRQVVVGQMYRTSEIVIEHKK